MGKRGPPKKPTRLRVLEGNPSKRPVSPDEPDPPRSATTVAPERIEGRARELWDELLPMLDRNGLYTEADELALGALCQVTAEVEELERVIRDIGMTFTTPNGYIAQRPEVGMLHKCRAEQIRLLDRFGLSPSARSGLQSSRPREKSPLQRWRDREEKRKGGR